MRDEAIRYIKAQIGMSGEAYTMYDLEAAADALHAQHGTYDLRSLSHDAVWDAITANELDGSAQASRIAEDAGFEY